MFGRKKEAPVQEPQQPLSSRYVVEAFTGSAGAIGSADKYAAGLQDLLNRGDARGWTLVHAGGAGASGAMMVIWDTGS